MKLPGNFLDNMKKLLGNEFDAFLESYNDKCNKGIRINRLKISSSDFSDISHFKLEQIPYIDNGFFYDDENPAKDPYYHAGLYYLQEPSAMLPANRLPVKRGDHVLDLCAAPGGKATELLGKLGDTGILYANDISASRASALLKNLELAGGSNYYVTAEAPQTLAERLEGFFNKILCDVPCSGEGMFRKDNSLISSYVKSNISDFVSVQRDILDNTYKMLSPGGLIMYSTCTFNTQENEENIAWFLNKYSDLELLEIEGFEGFTPGFMGLSECVRVFPHKMKGEGHFLTLIKKVGEDPGYETVYDNLEARTLKVGRSVFRLPALPDNGYRKGLRYLRTGLYTVDEIVNKSGETKIDFSQSYAMTLNNLNGCKGGIKDLSYNAFGSYASSGKYNEMISYVNLPYCDERVNKYLKGETLFLNEGENIDKGYTLILIDGFPLGFAKYDGSKLKNMYNPAWRMN